MERKGYVYGIVTAVVSYALLIIYLITSLELTPLGIGLSILVLLLNTTFLFGVIKQKKRAALVSVQLILGIIFIFSGFVKAVDPVGSMIKITDYLTAFNATGLIPIALIGAFILSSYEFPLGISMLLGAKGKLMSWLFLVTMVPFFILTFYLALKNPVTDCGCFGDALILSNWETFGKNVFIMFYVGYAMMFRGDIKPAFKGWTGNWGVVIASVIFILAIGIYSKMYLPAIDFRPYKVGNDIGQLMEIPEGEPVDEYENVFIYKNTETGEEHTFDVNSIPMEGPWEFVDRIDKLVKKGYEPPIHDFHIHDNENFELTDAFLSQEGYRLMIVHDKLEDSNLKGQKQLNALVRDLEGADVDVWALTSSLNEEIEAYIKENDVPYQIYIADYKLLKTIIRSNPGVVLFKDNVVVAKWSAYSIPDLDKLKKEMN